MNRPDERYRHATEVLELERVREVISSFAASGLGRGLALRLGPLGSVERARQAMAETLEVRDLLRTRRLPLQGLSDVAGELRSLVESGHPAEPETLYRVVDLLRAGQALRESLTEHPDIFPRLAALAGGLVDLPELREDIPAAVHPKDGVRDEATPRLAELRREVRTLRERVRRSVQSVQRRPALRRCFQAEGITFKNDRYLLPVKAEHRAEVRGPIRGRSQKGSTLYIEPEEVVPQGDLLVDHMEEERREVTRILWDLTRRVFEARPTLERLQSRLARIDLAYAKASWSLAYGCEGPEIEDPGGTLELRDARHPWLLWLARDRSRDIHDPDLETLHQRVAPLSLRLGGEEADLLIITGPNTGGKTVALKTVGLCALLSMSGVPVPCAPGSRVPFYDGVYADIGDEQSLEQSLSTFSSHLTRIVEILREADEKSLVLLDELGSGTDPLEGAALGRALLDRFRERGWTAIITTHLGSLKQYAYLHDGVENAAMEFDARTLTPTYRLLFGVPGSSKALEVAARLGLDESIVEAARAEVSEAEEPTREIISRMERSRRRIEKERRRTERVRRRAQSDAQAVESRRQEVEARGEALSREADEEIERIVREARERLLDVVQKLKNVPQPHRARVDELEAMVRGLLVSTPLGERREEFAHSLRKEDEVWVPRFRCRAKVRKINKGERLLTVLVNGIPVQIGFDDVTWIDPSAPPGSAAAGESGG